MENNPHINWIHLDFISNLALVWEWRTNISYFSIFYYKTNFSQPSQPCREKCWGYASIWFIFTSFYFIQIFWFVSYCDQSEYWFFKCFPIVDPEFCILACDNNVSFNIPVRRKYSFFDNIWSNEAIFAKMECLVDAISIIGKIQMNIHLESKIFKNPVN